MSLGTGRVGLSGASAGGGGGVTATLTRSDVIASSALLTLSLSAGATLVSWSVQRRKDGGAWSTIVTGLTDLEYSATGLDSSSDYDFQGIDIVATVSTESGVVSVVTADAPAIDPYRDFAVLTPFAANMGDLTIGATTDYTVLIQTPPIPAATTWTGVRLRMAGRSESPIAPTGVSVALCNGGDQNNPTLDGGAVTWVNGASLVTPSAGTDDEPGLSAVCADLSVSSQPGARMLCVRFRLPAGTHTGAGVNGGGVGTDPSAYPVGVSTPKAKTSGNLTDTSGWGEAFGNCPWFSVEYLGLSESVLPLGVFGDSHPQGYISVGSNGNRGPFGALEASTLWAARPNINLINFGRMGHTTAQISARMLHILAQYDLGGVLRQRASINDHDANFDVLQPQADASWAQLQSDADAVAALGGLFIPFSPAGANGWASGWFSRFTSHVSDEIARFGANGVGVVYEHLSILNADGTYQSGLATPDNSHPTTAAQLTWGEAMWPTLLSVLTTKGYAV